MEFIEQMREKAKLAPKKIIFPEAMEEKILLAARRALDLGFAFPILVGREADITARAAEVGVSTEGFAYVDHEDEAAVERLITTYLSVSAMYSEKTLRRKFKTPLHFAAGMVRIDRADCLAAGFLHTTADVVLAAQMFIGMQDGIHTISSLGIVEFPNWSGPQGNFLAFTDCAVQPRPSSEGLADIAIASADTVHALLGWEPRVAMLSFSTKGSTEHEDADVVIESVSVARAKRPGLLVDGEFQLDSAILPAIAAKKIKEPSEVAGRANVLVFPNLGAGNIGVKMAQIFGGAIAYGPMMQGFAKPVSDFSRAAPLEEIVGNLAMLVVRAGRNSAAFESAPNGDA